MHTRAPLPHGKIARPLAAFGVLLALALPWLGCGGGSGGGSPTAPEVRFETEIEFLSFDLINQARHDQGLDPVMFDSRLSQIARAYSEEMRDLGFFAHVDPNGHDAGYRLHQAGVVYTVVGENLARVDNAGDPARFAHQGFLNNPPHRANMLDPRFTRAGVGVARRAGRYWITQLYVRQ